MAKKYNVDTKLRIVGKCKGFDDQPKDPTTAILRIVDPSDVETTPPVTIGTQAEDGATVEVGTVFGDVTPNASELWRYRWETTGVIVATDQGTFRVEADALP